MLTIKGKFNSAHVLMDDIDDETRRQIRSFCDDPSFQGPYIAIMPDCHAGMGSCIGFTMQMNDRIIPDVVGVDIGCGMLSCEFDLTGIDLPGFDAFIRNNIPSGHSIHAEPYAGDPFYRETVRHIEIEEERVSRSLGTLGGGNHFIEAGYGKNGRLWVTIHSGSRNFGLQIARYHERAARSRHEARGAEALGLPFLYVDSPEGKAYLRDAGIGVRYASLNRELMMKALQRFLRQEPIDRIESRHNFIDEKGMIRKGATPAHEGQRLVIPFNMRDGIAVCRGKGNREYNYSAPHGAGRVLSRSKAKSTLDVHKFMDEMRKAGVYTTTADRSTLDEAPEAYKDTRLILDSIADTVEVLDLIKPVYNFKAPE